MDDHNPTSLPQVFDELVSGSVTRTYAYGLQRISENQQISGNWTPRFYGYDGHGNVRFLANTVPSVTDSYDYDAFGMPIRTNGTTSNQFLYSGERLDANIGLYDLRARYYDQATGRFWGRDPVEGSCSSSSYNAYIYASDDPVNHVDPSGKLTVETLRLNFQPTLTIPQQIALGAVYLCSYFEVASKFGAMVQNGLMGYPALSNLQQVGPCWVKTTNTNQPDPCPPIRAEIFRYMLLIEGRIDAMELDPWNLYNLAYYTPNPLLETQTTWVGHQIAIQQLQKGLRDLLLLAQSKGCVIPPGAWALATRPAPIRPIKRPSQ